MPGILLYKNRFAAERIEFCIIHQAGIGRRGGGEDLHLLGVDVQFLACEGSQASHISLRAAGMGGDKVVGQELIFARCMTQAVEAAFELQKCLAAWLAHASQHTFFGVLRGYFHLPGNVILNYFA